MTLRVRRGLTLATRYQRAQLVEACADWIAELMEQDEA